MSKARKIMEAILHGELTTVKQLVAKEDVNKVYTYGCDYYPLEVAILYRQYEIAKYLLSLGADQYLGIEAQPLCIGLKNTGPGFAVINLKNIGLKPNLDTLCNALTPEGSYFQSQLFTNLINFYRQEMLAILKTSSKPLSMALNLYNYGDTGFVCLKNLLRIHSSIEAIGEETSILTKLSDEYASNNLEFVAKALFALYSCGYNRVLVNDKSNDFEIFWKNICLSLDRRTLDDIILNRLKFIKTEKKPFQPHPLCAAIRKENIEYIKSVVTTDNIEQLIDSGEEAPMPLLYHAIKHNKIAILEYLCTLGANMELAAEEYQTALIYAIKLENIDAVKVLIANGAKINPVINGVETSEALCQAIDCDNSPEILQTLLEHQDLNINLLDSSGCFPLMKLAKSDTKNKLKKISMLLAKKPNLDLCESEGQNIFDIFIKTLTKTEIAYIAVIMTPIKRNIIKCFEIAENKYYERHEEEGLALSSAILDYELEEKRQKLQKLEQEIAEAKRKLAATEEQMQSIAKTSRTAERPADIDRENDGSPSKRQRVGEYTAAVLGSLDLFDPAQSPRGRGRGRA